MRLLLVVLGRSARKLVANVILLASFDLGQTARFRFFSRRRRVETAARRHERAAPRARRRPANGAAACGPRRGPRARGRRVPREVKLVARVAELSPRSARRVAPSRACAPTARDVGAREERNHLADRVERSARRPRAAASAVALAALQGAHAPRARDRRRRQRCGARHRRHLCGRRSERDERAGGRHIPRPHTQRLEAEKEPFGEKFTRKSINKQKSTETMSYPVYKTKTKNSFSNVIPSEKKATVSGNVKDN